MDGVLPHLRTDLDQRFPKAEAGDELDDRDPETDDTLEANGMYIGSNGARFR